ncbi:adenylate and guanylate cyclase catalytic domain protein [Desulfosarcina variabilis str. Montpellier]|uniref:AAA family ATPase n=1 Tax=Desulfosarcina variabilis TaxID=2300 RepID=UPI003AFA9B28
MSCPYCQKAALANAKFCHQCGRRLTIDCPACGASNPFNSKFCGECGNAFADGAVSDVAPSASSRDAVKRHPVAQGERRHLTTLFTDLTGYSRMMEKFDPEDVQGLMETITARSVKIIKGYHGHIERIIGDEILAVFGLPVAHEDDAIRAIKAAREIHATVADIKPKSILLEKPLSMHTGINTGLVVTAHSAPVDGTFDLSGEAVNIASRLSDAAEPNEILVGPETYRQAFGFFDFDAKPPMTVEGATRPICIYAVKDEKARPVAGRRKLRFNAELIGRQAELDLLLQKMEALKQGTGAVISIVGEAGTGKSRLLAEFERKVAAKGVNCNWIVGYAYAHTQQVPYYPLVGIVRRWLALDGSATAEEMSAGIAQRVGGLLGPRAEEIPIIQGLIGQDVAETESMSPEQWRERLKTAMLNLLSAIASQAPTVFCMEDVHWGDAASLKLLKEIIFNFEQPAMVICTTRPHASLFTSHETELLAPIYSEIRIGELSSSETETMMASMLNTDILPEDLCRLIHQRTEGNPFYLEEILNALVDSDILVFDDGHWQMNRAFKEADIPSTIHGIIASRMDQLCQQDRRILQEAAVIGRAFLYDVLKRISVYADAVDDGLYKLERAGLIQPRALQPEMEFMFKHALIQEVGYGSLLRRERQRVHERIGRTIEHLYQDRLSEFDETLAIHFQKSIATDKATDYLIRSGTKALRRCALDESDQYFKTAKSMLEQEQLAAPETKKRLLDVVNQWAFVFYYRGMNRNLLELLEKQRSLVEGLGDPVREGFHWAWRGCALWHRHRFRESFDSLKKALKLGQTAAHADLIGYASTWLSWPCTELGRFDEAIQYSEKAETLFVDGRVQDAYLYFNALFGKGYVNWHKGDAENTRKIGKQLLKFGKMHGNVRSLVSGHCCLGWKGLIIGDIDAATASFKTAVGMSADPWYSQFPKLALCYGAISNGKIEEALPLLDQLIAFSDDNGAEFVGEPANFFKGLTTIMNGQIPKGLEIMESLLSRWQTSGCRLRGLTCGYVMGQVYLLFYQSALQTAGHPVSSQAAQLAEKCIHWFQISLSEARDMGAIVLEGQVLLGLGKALAMMDQTGQAADTLQQSMDVFAKIQATFHLKRVKGAIEALPASTSGITI